MDTTIAPTLELAPTAKAERPRYTMLDIPKVAHVLAAGIEDLNADALDSVCIGCKAPLSWGQWLSASYEHGKQTPCHGCNRAIFAGDFTSQHIPRRKLEEVQSEGYFEGTWYHASRNPSWAEAVTEAEDGELIIHAGSRLAALSRANELARSYYQIGEPIYMHSFTLRSTENISRTVVEDAVEDWPERLDSAQDHPLEVCDPDAHNEVPGELWFFLSDSLRAVPYYNRYEVPGDISLLLHAGLIDLGSVETEKL